MKPIKALFNQLGRSWTVSIMLQLGEEKELRYHEIREHVNASEEGDISDATLSKRLSDLTKLGLIKRKVITETPPQVSYSLTAAGEDTYKHIQTMTVWAQQMCHSGDSLDLSSSRNHKSEEVSC